MDTQLLPPVNILSMEEMNGYLRGIYIFVCRLHTFSDSILDNEDLKYTEDVENNDNAKVYKFTTSVKLSPCTLLLSDKAIFGL